MGGSGALPGIVVILTSALIGLCWRRWFFPKAPDRWKWLSVFVMSVTVHLAMLLCMLLLPHPENLMVIRSIAVPVMLIYPIASLLLSMLLLRQQRYKYILEQLWQSEERFRSLFEKAPLGYQSLDCDGNFIHVNQQWLDTLGYTHDEVVGKWFGDFVAPHFRDEFRNRFPVFKAQGHIHSEFEMLHKSGKAVFIAFDGKVGYGSNGEFKQTHCILQDITAQRISEQKLIHLSYHDHLTGLYNRRFFEEELVRLDTSNKLPLSVFMGDINGVKLVNDAFGHAEGDRLIIDCSKLIRECCDSEHIVARIGGDEFGILMPNTNTEKALSILNRIQEALKAYDASKRNDRFTHSVALGFATKTSCDQEISQILKIAEEYMYQRKLLEHTSSHSAIVTSIKATMLEKSHETEEHAERLVTLSKAVAKELKLSQSEQDRLELLATLHDIGKVGISDHILTKPGKLTEIEWVEMKRHPEIGYRIAISSLDLVPIAEGVLCHHERWDGNGYPQRLKEEKIPLLARILSVVDAYDAMTQDRPYRKAMSHDAAMLEIEKNSGQQFDPHIVEIFTTITFAHLKQSNEISS